MAQLSPPEYAFVASDAAWQRARGAVAALTALGYDARLYPPGAPEPQRAKAVVYCDAAPEVARAEGNTTYRLIRHVADDGREEVIVSGRRVVAA